ncbi:MAG TPA: glycosyltransferase family 4 protein, partial [Acidiphilium sp.]|nr:glycosyltransferase family 4 protein [Acidiphilium sp.]
MPTAHLAVMPRDGLARRFCFVTDEWPRPGAAGHLAYNHALITHLRAAGHTVDLYLTRPRLPAPVMRLAPGTVPVAGRRLFRVGRLLVAAEPRAAAAALLRRVAPWLLPRRGGTDVVLGASISAADSGWIAGRIAASRPDAILIDTIFRAPLLDEPSLSGIPTVLLTHDVFHRRHAALRLAGYSVAPAELDRAQEAALLARAGTLVAIQPEEAALLRGMCPSQRVLTVPMPAVPLPRPPGAARHADRLVFVGSDNLPNLDGLRWFLREIWPGLRRARPLLRLDLAGDCGAALGRLPAGVHRLGRIADLAPLLHSASLAIAPLRAGSGLKVKLLDYARHGLWTVATPDARAGLAPDGCMPVYTADSAASFGATILAALAHGGGEAEALAYIRRHYAPATIFATLDEA